MPSSIKFPLFLLILICMLVVIGGASNVYFIPNGKGAIIPNLISLAWMGFAIRGVLRKMTWGRILVNVMGPILAIGSMFFGLGYFSIAESFKILHGEPHPNADVLHSLMFMDCLASVLMFACIISINVRSSREWFVPSNRARIKAAKKRLARLEEEQEIKRLEKQLSDAKANSGNAR